MHANPKSAKDSQVISRKKVNTLVVLLSISLTFYKQLLRQYSCAKNFLCLQFGFVIFWRKNIDAKAARKMLMKLTVGLLQTFLVLYDRFSIRTYQF